MNDEFFMRKALELAFKGTGFTSPSPRVGCVIVHNGQIIAEGWHRRFGEPHAEANALAALHGSAPSDSTLYVNLEPCSHTGRNPPCADAIIKAGIQNVVIGITDPNPLVNGNGVSKLKSAGINVRTNVLQSECTWINRFFIKHTATRRPYIILKMAQSIDGFVAPINKKELSLTGQETARVVHALRSEVDAVMVGIGTVIADDPQLNVRYVQGRDPIRIIVDPNNAIPPESKVVLGASEQRTMVINAQGSMHNVIYAIVEQDPNISSIMCEGGAATASALLNEDLVDELRIHTAPVQLKNGLTIEWKMDNGKWKMENGKWKMENGKWKVVNAVRTGEDVLVTYVRSST